jgi:protein TonB
MKGYSFIFVFVTVFGLPFNAPAQTATCDTVYTIAEEMPELVGGMHGLYKFIGKNLKVTKECAPFEKIWFTFIVDRDGNVRDLDVLKGFEGECKTRFLEQLSQFPSWTPGKRRGKPVCVKMVMPMYLELAEQFPSY